MRQLWIAFLMLLWMGGVLCAGEPPTTTTETPAASPHHHENTFNEGIKGRERVYHLSGSNYILQYTIGDSKLRLERGGLEDGVWVVRGSVTTLREDGSYHTLYYLADQLGYRTADVFSDSLEGALSRHWKDGYLVNSEGELDIVDKISDRAAASLVGGG